MKKNDFFTALKLFVMMLALGAGSLFAQGTVTVQLLASDNATGLDGGNVYYYDGGWQLLGSTVSGTIAGYVPKKTDIEIRYIGGRYKWTNVETSANPTLTINTVAVTVKLETCDGDPLVGEALYYFGGFTSIGNTPATIELLPFSGLGPGQGNYDFRMKYDGRTSPIHTQDISVDPVVVFTTTKVSLYGTNVLWYNGGWQPFTSPKEVIGGTSNRYGNTAVADFKFDGSHSPTVPLDIDGCSLSGGILTLVDENGGPLANYPAEYPGETRNLKYKYRCGGSWAPWTSFQTDANGQVFYNIDCSTVGSGNGNWDGKITMTLNQTTLEQDVSVNSTFQAARVNVNLETCDPTKPLPGGVVAQGGGYWYTHGTTDATGTVSFYAFPGNNVKVRMNYNYKSVTQNSVAVALPTTEIDFITTTVNFLYSGTIKMKVGGWPVITTPIELLPGNYGFRFGSDLIYVDVSGCNLSKGLLTVVDENGNPVEGASFRFACGGSWVGTGGDTDADGHYFGDVPACMTKIAASVGNSGQEKTKAQLEASDYTWTTEILRVYLKDHDGNPITDQTGTLEQGGGSWIALGNFNASGYVDVQTFPTTSGRYQAGYNCTSETRNGITVAAGPGIQEEDFQTGQVFGPCITQYTGCGWTAFVDGMELMPGAYTFRNPSQSGTVTAGAVTNLTCPPPPGRPANPGSGTVSTVEYEVYPNPFGDRTAIWYNLPADDEISISILDAQGRLINRLYDGNQAAGIHQVEWNGDSDGGANVAAGIYYLRIITSEGAQTHAVVKK